MWIRAEKSLAPSMVLAGGRICTEVGPQALAAIGQGRLIALWDNLFGQLGQPIAQVLLTRGDISDVSTLSHP